MQQDGFGTQQNIETVGPSVLCTGSVCLWYSLRHQKKKTMVASKAVAAIHKNPALEPSLSATRPDSVVLIEAHQGLSPTTGKPVRYYNFDVQSTTPASVYVLYREGEDKPVPGQLDIIDTPPGEKGYNDFRQVWKVWVCKFD